MRDGFIRAAALTPKVRVADAKPFRFVQMITKAAEKRALRCWYFRSFASRVIPVAICFHKSFWWMRQKSSFCISQNIQRFVFDKLLSVCRSIFRESFIMLQQLSAAEKSLRSSTKKNISRTIMSSMRSGISQRAWKSRRIWSLQKA